MGKEICREFCKRLNLEAACFIPFLLRFWLLFFINVQSFGEEIKDISFCYDGSKEGGFRKHEYNWKAIPPTGNLKPNLKVSPMHAFLHGKRGKSTH